MGLYAETDQLDTLRTLVRMMHDVPVTAITMTFDETGLRITAIDANESILVHVRLFADAFFTQTSPSLKNDAAGPSSDSRRYVCDRPLSIEIDLLHLHAILEPLEGSSGYTIAFQIRDHDPPALGVIVTNDSERIWFHYRIRGTFQNQNPFERTGVRFPEKEEVATVATMRSDDFYRIVQEMRAKSSLIHVRITSDQLQFVCRGEHVDVQSVVSKTDRGLVYSRPIEMPIEGVYSLDHLHAISKAFRTNDDVDLYFRPEFALVLRYGLSGDAGDVRFGLSDYVSSEEIEGDDAKGDRRTTEGRTRRETEGIPE